MGISKVTPRLISTVQEARVTQASPSANNISENGKILFKAILFLREYLDYDALLKGEFEDNGATSPLLPAAVSLINGDTEDWVEALDKHLSKLTNEDKEAFIALFNLGIKAEDLDARTISEKILTQKEGSIDLLAALCKLDSEIGFCPAINMVNPNEIPADTPTDVIITGANLPIDGTIEVVDQTGTKVANSSVHMGPNPSETSMLSAVTVPTAGDYSIKVSDSTGRLSAVTPITVVEAGETLPTLTVIPVFFTPGEEENVHILGENINVAEMNPENLTLDIQDADGNSVLTSGAITLDKNKTIIDKDNWTITIGTIKTDKTKQVRLKVKSGTVDGDYTLVLKHNGTEVATQPIMVSGPKETKKKSMKTPAWLKIVNPFLDLEGRLPVPVSRDYLENDFNTLIDRSIAETQRGNVFNVGLRLAPEYDWGQKGKQIKAFGQAGLRYGYPVTSNLNARAGIGADIGNADTAFIPRLEAGIDNDTIDLEFPGKAVPFTGYTSFDPKLTLGIRHKAFALNLFYQYYKTWHEYSDKVLKRPFKGESQSHNVGAKAAVKTADFEGQIEGGYGQGTVDVPDSVENMEKETQRYFVNGLFHYPKSLLPYLGISYVSEQNRGDEKIEELQLRVGAKFKAFGLAQLSWRWFNYNSYNENRYNELALKLAPLEWAIIEAAYTNIDGENHQAVFSANLYPLIRKLLKLEPVPFEDSFLRNNQPIQWPSEPWRK